MDRFNDPAQAAKILPDYGATAQEVKAFTEAQTPLEKERILTHIAKHQQETIAAIKYRLALAHGFVPNTIDTSDADAA